MVQGAATPADHNHRREVGAGVPGVVTRQAEKWRLADALGESAQSLTTAIRYSDDPIAKVKELYLAALAASRDHVYDFVGSGGMVTSVTREFPDGATTNILLTENPKTNGTRIARSRMANR